MFQVVILVNFCLFFFVFVLCCPQWLFYLPLWWLVLLRPITTLHFHWARDPVRHIYWHVIANKVFPWHCTDVPLHGSMWRTTLGVPQGSVLGPLLFVIQPLPLGYIFGTFCIHFYCPNLLVIFESFFFFKWSCFHHQVIVTHWGSGSVWRVIMETQLEMQYLPPPSQFIISSLTARGFAPMLHVHICVCAAARPLPRAARLPTDGGAQVTLANSTVQWRGGGAAQLTR